MSFYLFLNGAQVRQIDPLTQKAREIVKRQLRRSASRYVFKRQDRLESHNQVDLYFGGENQWLQIRPERLKRQYLKRALRERSMKDRIADVKKMLQHRKEVLEDTTLRSLMPACPTARQLAVV